MKNIAFFDIDDTLLEGQCQLFLVKYLFKKGKVSRSFLVNIIFWFFLYKFGVVKNPQTVMKKSFILLRGWNEEEVNDSFNDFFNNDLVKRVKVNILSRLQEHQSNGDEVVIVTNVIEPLARIVSDYFNVNNLYSSVLEIRNGVYTGEVVGNIIYGKTKAEAARKFLGRYNEEICTFAYADHMSDKYILELVEKPVVVNPKKKLYNYAFAQSWEIIK